MPEEVDQADLDLLDDTGNETPEETEVPEEVEEEETDKEDQGSEDDEEPEETDLDEEGEKEPESKSIKPEDGDDEEVQGIRFGDIRQKFPTLFKEFPQLRHVFFRERQYSEIYPSVDDAREANEKASVLDALEEHVLSGDPGPLIRSIKDQKAQEAFARNFLPSLYEANPTLYTSITVPLLKNAIHMAAKQSEANDDKQTLLATKYLAKFFFGSTAIPDQEPMAVAKLERTPAMDEGRYKEFDEEVKENVLENINNAIVSHLKGQKLSPFLARSVAQSIGDEVFTVLRNDRVHNKNMEMLWNHAAKNGFSRQWKARIANAVLARANSILPRVAAKVKAEAIGNGPSKPQKRKDVPVSGRPGGKSPSLSPKSIDWKNTSDMDILNGRPKLRNKG